MMRMGRSTPTSHGSNIAVKKGPWSPEEDEKLLSYIEKHGQGSWRALPDKAGLQRCGKSCRLRWTNYLRSDIKRGKFTLQEEQAIIQLHALLGNRWSAIATHLPMRTDNEIKNYWNTHLKKRLAKMGIDPVTHKPNTVALSTGDGNASKSVANISHMAQWESARLEAEARLVRESTKLRSTATSSSSSLFPAPATNTPWQCEGGGQSHVGINLASPTSTLTTFSENNYLPVAVNTELMDWKCLAKPIQKDPTKAERFELDSSDEGNCADRDDGNGDGGGGENRSYWNSILSLVNSVNDSSSPPFF